MKMLRRVLLLVLFLAPLLFCWRAVDAGRSRRHYDLRPPIEVVLDWTGQPGLHRTITLTAQVQSEIQVDHLVLRWVLPPGATLAGTQVEDLGPVAAGQTVTRQRDVTFDQAGSFEITAAVQAEDQNLSATWGAAGTLFFNIQKGAGSTASRTPPSIPREEYVIPPNVQFSVSAAPHGGYWVKGRFLYEDKPVSTSGPGTAVDKPARYVKVEVWEDDAVFDDLDGVTHTDANGVFSFWVPDNDDGWLGGDKETFVRIYPNNAAAYVTDSSWIDEEWRVRTGNYQGGQDIDLGTFAPATISPMFNIADVALDAWTYACQYRSAPKDVKFHYEPGYGDSGSYYDDFWNEITIADSDDPDAYDDTVIIHEYGHRIADKHCCDDSDGGAHDVYKHYNDDLAWSEGWANYLSSAVRSDSHYLDWNWNSSSWSVSVDWEPWTVKGSDNEGAVTATLWDLHDAANESHDKLALGGQQIWYVFDHLMEEEWYNDAYEDCDIHVFWDDWIAAGFPDDSELAAIFGQHGTGGTSTAGTSRAGVVRGQRPAAAQGQVDFQPYSLAEAAGLPRGGRPETIVKGGLPWNAVLFLVDATNSMSGEIAAVRQVIQEKVTDMDAEPYPYEYTVETFRDDGRNTAVVDHFFPEIVNPPVGNISVGGGGDPAEDSFAALARGTAGRPGYEAWLFTDAAPKYQVDLAQLEGLLQQRQVTPYFFIFGDCSGGNTAGGTGTESVARPYVAPLDGPHLPRFAPAGLEQCVEPYLQIAGSTNGQLLLIDSSQVGSAAEIVRALMSNNAGSGRYANYVSSSWSYRWEDTAYDWYDATGGIGYTGDDYFAIELTPAFTLYNTPQQVAYIAAPGYVSFSPISAVVRDNGALPSTAAPNNAVYAFWDDITTYVVPGEAEAPGQSLGVYADWDTANNRFVVEWYQAYHRTAPGNRETFEILLDYDTGEIILQYAQVSDDSSCTVGVENSAGSAATQVAYNNPGALQAGRAIRLIPQPPQPQRDHEVIVDSSMSGVVFMLNGYSGQVNMTVLRPNGTPVNPDDPGVTFLDVGKIKYYRLNSAEAGTWIARVSGEGTYYFTSSGTSSLKADFQGDLTMGLAVGSPMVVDLGTPVNSASFSLVNMEGRVVDAMTLYDDGQHGDGEAGDGRYAGSYTPLEPGMFYLQVDGQTMEGEPFRRTELTPLRFQPMRLVPPAPARAFGAPGELVLHQFVLHNDTPDPQEFFLEVNSTRGWGIPPSMNPILVSGNGSTNVAISITIPLTAGHVVEWTTLTAMGGVGADSAVVSTTVRGPVAAVHLEAYPDRLVPNQQATIVAFVSDGQKWGVADGTPVDLFTTLGTLDPPVGSTVDGILTATLSAGANTGVALVEAHAGGVVGTIEVEISPSPAYSITLSAADSMLPPDGTTTTQLTAQVYDRYGLPAPDGTEVRFGVEGDAGEGGHLPWGAIEGQEAFTATTSGGMATATYRSGTTFGVAALRAGINLGNPAGDGEISSWRWAEAYMYLTAGGWHVYLPLVVK